MEEIKVENQGPVSRKISITLPPDLVGKKFDDYYNDLKNKVVLNGFRKGKIPRSVLENQFGPKAKSAVSQSLFSEYYAKALSDNAIAPVAMPNIVEVDHEKQVVGKFDAAGYSVNVVVEVMPTIDAAGYQGMTLKFPATDIATLVDGKIHELQERFAERRGVDRGAQLGDCVVVDFTGTVDDKVVPGLKEDGFTIQKLGGGSTIAGFDDALIGAGRQMLREFDLTFPEQYVGGLGGKTAHFKVMVQNVIEVKTAEVDEDLALMAGSTSVEELRKTLETEVIKSAEKVNRSNLELQIVSKLAKENQVEVPEGAVQQEKSRILADLQNRKVQVNAQIISNIEASARYNLTRQVIIEAIYNKESSIEITPEELDAFLEQSSKTYNIKKDDLVSKLYAAKQMDAFLVQLKTDKVLDFVINQAKPESEETEAAVEKREVIAANEQTTEGKANG
jgi:trigger factor